MRSYVPTRIEAIGAVAALAITAAIHADTIFVDADATGAADGSDWDNAYTTLQDALADAAAAGGAIDEVRIAGGLYTPDQGAAETTGDRLATFQLIDGVTLRGGFAGAGAPDPDARDLEAEETTLSGDLLGDDTGAPDDASHAENSLHVVTASGTDATAVLDGVTITGGNADVSGHTAGGGIVNVSGSPTIEACTIVGNAAFTGAGMDNVGGSPRITGCRFTANKAVSRGGGFRNTSFGSPHLVECLFDVNDGGSIGGAIDSQNSGGGNPEMVACTFIGNFVSLDGGAMNVKHRINVTNGLFLANRAVRGGAVRSDVSGGGSRFIGCTFNGNLATSTGGAINSFCSSFFLCNNTRVINSIAWGNTPDEITGGDLAVTHSDVQGGFPGTGNVNVDPMFADPAGADGVPGTGDEDVRVVASSPIVDAGANTAVPADAADIDNDGDLAEDIPFDLDGNARIIDGDGDGTATVDLGAFEFVPNFAPDADALVEQVTNIGDEALVRLDGSASSDVEDPVAALTFEWIVDGVTVCTGPAAACAVVEANLSFGSHTVELIVTDTGAASDTRNIIVNLDPAALSLVEITKLKVEFAHDPARAKLSGAIGLPFGVDFAEVAPLVLVELDIAGFGVVDAVPIPLEISGSHKWKYRDPDAPFGIEKLDIDWDGARFRFKENDVPVEFESEIIGSAETVLAIKYKVGDAGGAMSIDIDGQATLDIDANGLVTGTVPIEVEKPGREVTVTLPFALLASSVVTVTGAVDHTVTVADHYATSVGRFKLDVEFDGALFPNGAATAPRTVELSIGAGDQFYPGTASLDEADVRIDGDKWKERK